MPGVGEHGLAGERVEVGTLGQAASGITEPLLHVHPGHPALDRNPDVGPDPLYLGIAGWALLRRMLDLNPTLGPSGPREQHGQDKKHPDGEWSGS
jgi:hypothetical protein